MAMKSYIVTVYDATEALSKEFGLDQVYLESAGEYAMQSGNLDSNQLALITVSLADGGHTWTTESTVIVEAPYYVFDMTHAPTEDIDLLTGLIDQYLATATGEVYTGAMNGWEQPEDKSDGLLITYNLATQSKTLGEVEQQS